MDNTDNRHNRRKKRKKQRLRVGRIIFLVALIGVLVAGSVILYGKFAPSTEHMALEDYFLITNPDEAAVVLNGEYEPKEADHSIDAIISAGEPFVELSYLKENLDIGYVYDSEGGILRYTTDTELISVDLGSNQYSVGRDVLNHDTAILISAYDSVYVNLDFVSLYTDIEYSYFKEPNRVAIETAGTQKNMALLNKDTAIRRFGGPKSKILKDALKGDRVWIKENYGKWSLVITDDAVIGCVENKRIPDIVTEEVASHIPERVYTHNLMDEKIKMGWHMISNALPNSALERLVSTATGLNVICPTWYRIADNDGNVGSSSSIEYVNKAHAMGIKVWAMVSNFDVPGVDTTMVLNRISSRDNLVNQLISRAISDNVDGINIDFEALSINAKDGFIQFIREISLKCKANGIVLSIANYKPEAHTMFYNRTEQSKYADYIMVMAYDEYYSDSGEAGSNSSLPFVEECVRDTLDEVPKEQLLLALPFYTRIWTSDETGISNKSLGMTEANRIVDNAGVDKIWLNEQQQYYAEYESEGRKNQVWLEDEQSLAAKLSVAKDSNLAGAAFWKLGFETSSVWTIINSYIQ